MLQVARRFKMSQDSNSALELSTVSCPRRIPTQFVYYTLLVMQLQSQPHRRAGIFIRWCSSQFNGTWAECCWSRQCNRSEDITLESMVDWLVGYVAKSLPQFPKWVCLLCFEEERTSGPGCFTLISFYCDPFKDLLVFGNETLMSLLRLSLRTAGRYGWRNKWLRNESAQFNHSKLNFGSEAHSQSRHNMCKSKVGHTCMIFLLAGNISSQMGEDSSSTCIAATTVSTKRTHKRSSSAVICQANYSRTCAAFLRHDAFL